MIGFDWNIFARKKVFEFISKHNTSEPFMHLCALFLCFALQFSECSNFNVVNFANYLLCNWRKQYYYYSEKRILVDRNVRYTLMYYTDWRLFATSHVNLNFTSCLFVQIHMHCALKTWHLLNRSLYSLNRITGSWILPAIYFCVREQSLYFLIDWSLKLFILNSIYLKWWK